MLRNHLDTFSVINLNSPWAGQYFLLVVIYVAGNKKLLCSRIAIAIRHTKYFALRPFKFRKASGNSGQQKLNLFGCQMKTGDNIFITGTTRVILYGDSNKGVNFMTIFFKFSFCMKLCIAVITCVAETVIQCN